MVDAAEGIRGVSGLAGNASGPAVAPGLERAQFARFSELCGRAAFSPSQEPGWISAWATCVNPDIIIASPRESGSEDFAIALEVVRQHGVTIARFPGGRHANGNFAPVTKNFSASESAHEIITDISAKRPDIDLVHLERQARIREEIPNPFLNLDHQESPNISLAADIKGGFDALMATINGKRKRKKHRSHQRKFEDDGGFRCYTADSRQECDRLLDFFFEAKADRFHKAGIPNVFDDPSVQEFFRNLFGNCAADRHPSFQLNALEVAGELRAVTGTSICGKRIVSEFGAVADVDTSRTSPGEFLYFETIKKACNDGFEIYDFSVGDEPYKRQWCLLESTQFDTLIPLSARGRIAAAQLRTTSTAKRWIKRHAGLWEVARKSRAILTGK